jgi:hypothetical protein
MANINELFPNGSDVSKDLLRKNLAAPVVNVQGYGAVGDGKADDRPAIAAAAQQAAGATLFLPAGRYRLAQDLALAESVSLLFLPGAILVPDRGVTITIDGNIDAGAHQLFDLGAAGSALRGRIKAPHVLPQWFGAKGDNQADDTRPLQQAIDAALQAGVNLSIPAGRYKTSATLTVGSHAELGGKQTGWKMLGAGKTGSTSTGVSGTAIILHGDGFPAILQVNSSIWRFCSFEDIGLVCDKANGASYGVLFNSTEFSQHFVYRLYVEFAKTAFGIRAGTGANGEFILFEGCAGKRVDNFFHSAAGQAYVQEFHHCAAAVNPGGTYFTLALEGMGAGGLNIFDFNASSDQTNRISNTTLLDVQGNNSCLNIIGGRIEHLTRLVKDVNCPPGLRLTAMLKGLQITVDHDKSNPSLGIGHFIELAGSQSYVLENCHFQGESSGSSIPINFNAENVGAGQFADLTFRNCGFELSVPPSVSDGSIYGQLHFYDCWVTDNYDPNAGGGRKIPFDRHIGASIPHLGKRQIHSENAHIQSGIPENLLLHPEMGGASGNAVAPPSPWIASNPATINRGKAASASPFGFSLRIPAGQEIKQDITTLDLSNSGNYNIYGKKIHLVQYQALVLEMTGDGGSLLFSIVNSKSGAIYDSYQLSSAGTNAMRLVTLQAAIDQTEHASFPQLRLSCAGASGFVSCHVAWQFLSGKIAPAFAPAGTLSSFWALAAEGARFWSRLAIPYKTDNWGSAASPALPDLGAGGSADEYLSASDGQRTVFNPFIGAWAKEPLWTSPGAASATAGSAKLDSTRGTVTSEELSTAAGADYTLTLSNRYISSSSVVLASVANGSNRTEGIAVHRVQPGAGAAVIHVRNTNASAPLNGSVKISFAVL